MALPKRDAPPSQYHRSGTHTESMLDLEDRTRDLVPSIQPHNQRLLSLIRQDEDLHLLLIKAYTRVLWADSKLDDLARDTSADLKKLDRAQPSLRAHDQFFPEGGFSSVIQPSGRLIASQIKTLRDRFPVLKSLAVNAPELQSNLTKLESACDVAEAALAALQTLDDQRDQLRIEIDVVLEAWRTAAYQIEGELNKRFPGRKDLVRNFFSN